MSFTSPSEDMLEDIDEDEEDVDAEATASRKLKGLEETEGDEDGKVESIEEDPEAIKSTISGVCCSLESGSFFKSPLFCNKVKSITLSFPLKIPIPNKE